MKKLTEKVIFIAEDNGEIRTMIRFDMNKRAPISYKCSQMSMEEIGDSYDLQSDTVGGIIKEEGGGGVVDEVIKEN